MAKVMKKAQTGRNVPKGMVESEMFPGKMIPKSKSNYENSNYDKMLGGKSSAPKPKGLNFDKKSFDKLPTLKSKVIKKPKAQNGVASVMTPGPGFAPELRQGQKDRISKIIKKDSHDRANKVATRMTNRASKKSLSPNFGRFTSEIRKNGGKTMLKRADGSYSKRGLWDNIRNAKGSGKKPTAAMLKQEKKIKAKTK